MEIKLQGQAVREGRVSVRLLTRTLSSVQNTVYQLGSLRLKRDPAARGRLPEAVER